MSSSVRLTEVAEGAYAYIQDDGSWFVNNAGILVGSRQGLLVDTCATVNRTRELLSTARGIGLPPNPLVVATHHHADHTNGLSLVEPSAIIAHAEVPGEMAAAFAIPPPGLFEEVEWGEIEVCSPTLTFEDRLSLDLGGLVAEVVYCGSAAHTRGDSYVYLPESRVLFAGDLVFNGVTPFAAMGSISGWIEALVNLAELAVDVVVPGHGELCDTSVMRSVGRYLRLVQEVARGAVEAGVSPLEAARSIDLGEFAGWLDTERIVGNLHAAMAELAGGAVDLMGAFLDMKEYAGGRPLRCIA